ncbi:MAG: sensor histidine kinase [Helicobacteraceae bacterium]|jgi:signal transduction histidine kinase|nr:sensor histidine kinase [Helicobacteraceae bacterium]
MSEIQNINDGELIAELSRRLDEKNASIKEVEFLTKKLLSLNEKTKESESIKERFISIVINVFSNPIKSLLELSNSLIVNGDPSSIAGRINAGLLGLDFEFSNIFAAALIENGKIESSYSNIKFGDIFQSARNALRYLIDRKNLVVTLNACEDDDFVSDERKIYTILINLLSNACEFSYPNSQVDVDLTKLEDEFVLCVADCGEGVDAQCAAQVYCRFAAFSSGKTRSRQGLGLGLSVARGFSEALCGSIDFESKKGQTVFRVRLPIAQKSNETSDDATDPFADFKNNAVEL